ncbi:peroxin 26 [Seiridium cupressi]
MAFNTAYTATLSPGADSGFGSHHQVLSSSISSLSSSTLTRPTPNHISKTYRQSSQLFLTRRLPEALSTVQPLITPPSPEEGQGESNEPAPIARASRSTRIKVWSLYLTILNAILELEPDEGKEAFGTHEWRALCAKVRDGAIWEEVVQNGYHGIEGEVDSDVVINLATLLLAHARTQTLNQKRLENYLAASQQPNLDISQRLQDSQSPHLSSRSPRSPSKSRKGASGADTPRDLNARVKILELYTLHVLLRNNEWDYAREFITVSSVLDEERRDAFLQALQSLREEQQEQDRREQEEKQRQDDQLKRDLEEARKYRAENEARERRRLEEERARREGSEVDYGIDNTPSANGSSKGRRTRGSSSALSRPKPPAKGKAAGPPSLSARAAMIISNLRNLFEQMGTSFKTNPMLLMRLIAFLAGLILMFGNQRMRERITRVLGTGWNKVKATAGMGVKTARPPPGGAWQPKDVGMMLRTRYSSLPSPAPGTLDLICSPPIRLLLIKQICPRTTQIDNLRASVPILLQPRALEAVEGIRYALAAADDALVLVVAERALVADAHQGCRSHVRVAYRTLAVALVAETADGYAGLLAAHY